MCSPPLSSSGRFLRHGASQSHKPLQGEQARLPLSRRSAPGSGRRSAANQHAAARAEGLPLETGDVVGVFDVAPQLRCIETGRPAQ
eukprot:scaffold1150_cov135-Isochrysis_galbana.AAC.1